MTLQGTKWPKLRRKGQEFRGQRGVWCREATAGRFTFKLTEKRHVACFLVFFSKHGARC